MSKVKCFNCGKKGHIAPNCPENEEDEQEIDTKKKQFVTWEDKVVEGDLETGSYVTYQVYNSVHPGQHFSEYDLLLDDQADISVVHPCLLCEIMQADTPVTVNGKGGKQLVAMQTGYLVL
jgi:hypothetical protein